MSTPEFRDKRKDGKNKNKNKNNRRKTNWAERRRLAAQRRDKYKQEGEGDNHDARDNANYEKTQYSMRSIKFDLYYRKLLDPLLEAGSATTPEEAKLNKDEDFRQFREYLRQKLPITFRVNPLNVGHENLTRQFLSKTFIKDWIDQNKENPEFQGKKGRISTIDEDELEKIHMINHEFYPNNLLFQMPLARDILKKDTILANIHKFIQKCGDSGLMTRQEVVSMIPPMLLDVKPGHKIYDA